MLFTLLFVIIIYAIYSVYQKDPYVTLGLSVVGVVFVALAFSYRTANLVDGPPQTELRPIDTNVQSIDKDVSSKNFDMPLSQVDRDIAFTESSADNADVVSQFLTGGSEVYEPQEAKSANYYSVHDLAFPHHAKIDGKADLLLGSLVPLNDDAINMDDKLARGQTHRSEMNKRAIDGAVRATRNQFDKYFANELPENESREWWSHQADDNETDYKYYQ